ncbi:MAG: hypothetical protein J6O49_10010 [Bacteroidaceae bacterium]|nr:hypothetical protein [Bacteroidaceae bacterium]
MITIPLYHHYSELYIENLVACNKKGRIPMFKKIALATLAAVCVSIATPALASDYLGNPKSMKFHYSSCSTIKHPERFVEFSTRDDAIAAGYVPCKRCNP